MRVLILGGDGYLGWPTAMRLAARGDDVMVVDNYLRRTLARDTGSVPLVATPLLPDRAAETPPRLRRVGRAGALRCRCTVPVNEAHSRATPSPRGVVGKRPRLKRQLVGKPQVVRVEKRDAVGARVRDTDISHARPVRGVLLAQNNHPRVAERFEPRDRVIGRPVVDDDQLPVRDGLRENGMDGLLQVHEAVVGRQNDRNRGRHSRSVSCTNCVTRVAGALVNSCDAGEVQAMAQNPRAPFA